MAKLTDRTELTTPADGDLYVTTDVSDTTDAATGTDKKITWANIKAGLKTYFDTLYVALTGDQTIAGVKTFSSRVVTPTVRSDSSAGSELQSSGTNTVLHWGSGGGANATAYGGWNFDGATADTIASFGASKTLSSLATATYPSLTELSYVKGVTSAIQTQLNAKAPTASPTFTGTTDVARLDYDRAIGGVSAIGNLGTTETIDFSTHTHYTGTLDNNITFTFSNPVSGETKTLYLSYDGTAQRTITWPTVTWLDNSTGAAPATPAASGKVLVVTLVYIGTTYYASATGNYAVY